MLILLLLLLPQEEKEMNLFSGLYKKLRYYLLEQLWFIPSSETHVWLWRFESHPTRTGPNDTLELTEILPGCKLGDFL